MKSPSIFYRIKNKHFLFALLPVIIVFLPFTLEAQDYMGTDTNENRTALIIGNGKYKMGLLANPVNDATAMAEILKKVGFEVLLHTELLNKDEMKKVIRDFGRKLQNGGVGLFYYAGHGLQVEGINYLIPSGAEIYNQEEVEYECVEAGFVLAQMENARNRMNIVIMDACRDNPFARSFRDSKRGLATINAPTGTLIAYATAPGSVASDGTGKNGLYTEILLNEIQVEGQKIEETFKNVRRVVMSMSDGRQIPWESSSLIGDFYFVPLREGDPVTDIVSEPAQTIIQTEKPAAGGEPSRAEMTWKSDNNGQYVYKNNNLINENVQMAWAGEDALVYENATGKTYVLRNCANLKDGRIRAAEPLNLSGDLFWKKNGQGFYLFEKGLPIQRETISDWFGDDLYLYHGKENRGYILRGFRMAPANQYNQPEDIRLGSPLMWGKQSSEIFMFENGKRLLVEAVKKPVNMDILVYSKSTNTSYLLKNYTSITEGQLYPAHKFDSEDHAFWKANDIGYWFYLKGVEVTNDTENKRSGDDVQVFYKDQTFLLKDYLGHLDNQIQPAQLMGDAPPAEETAKTPVRTGTDQVKAEWKANDEGYWFYLDGREVADDDTNYQWTNDKTGLIVTHIPSGKKYLLRNYKESLDNKIRLAEEMK